MKFRPISQRKTAINAWLCAAFPPRSALEGAASLHATELTSALSQLERWQQRCTSLVQKYGSVDVEEYNRLVTQVASLEAQLEAARKEAQVGATAAAWHGCDELPRNLMACALWAMLWWLSTSALDAVQCCTDSSC